MNMAVLGASLQAMIPVLEKSFTYLPAYYRICDAAIRIGKLRSKALATYPGFGGEHCWRAVCGRRIREAAV